MKMNLKELLEAIKSSDLPQENKIDLMHRVSVRKIVTEGLYIKEVTPGIVECWYRNMDEDGTLYHGPTGYGIEDIIREYSRSISHSMKK